MLLLLLTRPSQDVILLLHNPHIEQGGSILLVTLHYDLFDGLTILGFVGISIPDRLACLDERAHTLSFLMGIPRPLFCLFLSFLTNITILTKINVKNVHPVYGAVIQTHNLQNKSLLP